MALSRDLIDRSRCFDVWIDRRRVTLPARSVVVAASVELTTVNARPCDAVDVQVDGDNKR